MKANLENVYYQLIIMMIDDESEFSCIELILYTKEMPKYQNETKYFVLYSLPNRLSFPLGPLSVPTM